MGEKNKLFSKKKIEEDGAKLTPYALFDMKDKFQCTSCVVVRSVLLIACKSVIKQETRKIPIKI